MSYIFIDESGDLGFDFNKTGTSKFFVITCLFVPGAKGPIEKTVKKTHSEQAKKLKKRSGVLHAYKEKPTTIHRLLKRLSSTDCYCMVIVLNKEKVYTKLQDEKHVLYNYVTNILLDRIHSRKLVPSKGVHIYFSQRETSKFLNQNFQNYIHTKLQKRHNVLVDLKVVPPTKEKGLQAVDFVSWAIFRKYEHCDDAFYKVIRPIIIEESSLFP